MKRTILAASAMILLGSGSAFADCREELAQLSGGGGISKDGSLAPLESGATPQTGDGTAPAAEGEGLAKDGSTEPLQADADVAMSAEDAQAQQQGGETAAAQAAGVEGGGDAAARDAALARAQAALDAGDEAGCMAALQEARG